MFKKTTRSLFKNRSTIFIDSNSCLLKILILLLKILLLNLLCRKNTLTFAVAVSEDDRNEFNLSGSLFDLQDILDSSC